ncbi:hypothetical protein AAH994_10355 [Weeksellaceae bacterium A-14]
MQHIDIKTLMLYFFTAPLKWVVGSVAKKRGLCVGKKKYGFRSPKNISIGIVRGDIFSGSGLWHWLFYIMLL